MLCSPRPRSVKLEATFKEVQAAGPPREIPMGKIEQPVAAAPLDADFEKAAVWRVKIPAQHSTSARTRSFAFITLAMPPV